MRTFTQPWFIYAFLSALAAAFVGVCGKVGMRGVDSTLATAVRSVIMTVFLVGLCFVLGLWSRTGSINAKAMWMIVLSGLAGAVSWLFYFKALQHGEVSQVAPIDKLSMPLAVILAVILLPSDRPTSLNWLGIAMIAVGGYLAAVQRA